MIYVAYPLKEYLALIVIGFPSLSTKYDASLIFVLYKCFKLTLGGAVETSLGAVLAVPLTMLTLNVVVE